MEDRFATHVVENQPPPLTPCDPYASDPVLRELVQARAAWAEPQIAAYGPVAGGELMELGFQANENPPRFKPFDRYGHRIDEVEFHPSYHRLMQLAMQHEVASFAWKRADKTGAQLARGALLYLSAQAEQGHNCPLTMTYAAVPALRHAPALAAQWLPRITSTQYDPRALPAAQKTGCTLGMGMTEKQGGSDVRANSTRASAQSDGSYTLVGHKWFFSAPMSDAFLVLAYVGDQLSCFLLPRFLDSGERNAVRIQRLKDKLGDRSNASSEVEFQGATAYLVGALGRGVATILEMVALTRQDCMIGSAATMRQALVQALHHARHRRAFGRVLSQQPLMQNVLADLALESEAALRLSLRVAWAIDRAPHDAREASFARVATAIGKYWVCRRCAPFVNEAQECLGGAGYVEESILPRLYRQAPLNSIWEGSGNVQCLDVLRALQGDAREVLLDELNAARGQHAAYDAALRSLSLDVDQAQARMLTERLALLLQASLLLREAPAELAALFCASRLGGEHGLAFGTLPVGTPWAPILERAFPESAQNGV